MQSVVCAGRTLVVSPHLDDAVLSCGQFLAAHGQATVLTAFTGMPGADINLTPYDRQCGFSSSTQAMRTRLDEDISAMAVLGSVPVYLGELDSQYAPLPFVPDLAARLYAQLTDPQWETVLVPMGLFHCDHVCVADACLDVMRTSAGVSAARWVAYEDVPYRRRGGVMQTRLADLAREGWQLTPTALEPPIRASGQPTHASGQTSQTFADMKARALACYASQLHTLGLSNGGDQDAPERFWSILPLEVK